MEDAYTRTRKSKYRTLLNKLNSVKTKNEYLLDKLGSTKALLKTSAIFDDDIFESDTFNGNEKNINELDSSVKTSISIINNILQG